MAVFEKDLVLIYFEDEPAGFARVEEINPDIKKGWYHVKLLLLNLPLQTVSWILRDVYIDGAEFTMGGHRMRLEKVETPQDDDFESFEGDDDEPETGEHITVINRLAENTDAADESAPKAGKVVSFNDFKNRKK